MWLFVTNQQFYHRDSVSQELLAQWDKTVTAVRLRSEEMISSLWPLIPLHPAILTPDLPAGNSFDYPDRAW